MDLFRSNPHSSSAPSPNVLTRTSRSVGPIYSPLQNQIDQLVTGFFNQATDARTLAALTAGGMAYRWGKMGVINLGVGAIGRSPARVVSLAVGLGAEVTAFEFTNRTLHTLRATGQSPLQNNSPFTVHDSPNLWSWSGPGGWKQSLFTDFVTFGLLKGAGHLGRGSNLILQHSFASAAMVVGHNAAGSLGWIPKPEGTLGEQLIHAEATNLQMQAGMGLVHAMAPGLNHSLSFFPSPLEGEGARLKRAGEGDAPPRNPLQLFFPQTSPVGSFSGGRDKTFSPHFLSESNSDGGGGEKITEPMNIGKANQKLINIMGETTTWDLAALERLAEFILDYQNELIHHQKGEENPLRVLHSIDLAFLDSAMAEDPLIRSLLHFFDEIGHSQVYPFLLKTYQEAAPERAWAVLGLSQLHRDNRPEAEAYLKTLNLSHYREQSIQETPQDPLLHQALMALVRIKNPEAFSVLAYSAPVNAHSVLTLKNLKTLGYPEAEEILIDLNVDSLLRRAFTKNDSIAQLAVGLLAKWGNPHVAPALEKEIDRNPRAAEGLFESFERGQEGAFLIVSAMESHILARVLASHPDSKVKKLLLLRGQTGDPVALQALMGKTNSKKKSIYDLAPGFVRWYRHRPMDIIKLIQEHFFRQYGITLADSSLLPDQLLKIAREEIFWPGEAMIREGENSQDVFLILQGTVKVHDQAGQIRRHLKKGHLLGEGLISKPVLQKTGATAGHGVTALRFPAQALRDLAQENPEVLLVLERAGLSLK